MQTLDPCSWRYVLNMDDLARFRLKARSDVVSAWAIASTTINNFYCQVKVEVATQCFTPTISRSGATYCAEKSDKVDSTQVKHTRTLLLPSHLTGLFTIAFHALKKDNSSASGAARAYRESQSRIYKLEAPLYVGVGEGTDSLDFHADLCALKAILPDEMTSRPSSSQPVLRSDSTLLQKLKQGEVPYAFCAWCTAALTTKKQAGRAPLFSSSSCSSTVMLCSTVRLPNHYGKGIAVEQGNFESFSTGKLLLRPNMGYDEAKDIIGAACSVLEDQTKIWYVKMPGLFQAKLKVPDLVSPALHWLDDKETDLNDYLADPKWLIPKNQCYAYQVRTMTSSGE